MIEIKNISKTFKNNKVLDGIDLTINQGDVVAIIGPSGTGKSTFLRCVDRLEKPETGTITIDGETQDLAHIHGKDLTELRKKTGMVFQNFNLFPHYSVWKNVIDAPIHVQKRDRAEVEKTAMELLEKMGIADKKDSYPCQLSGGQQQRLCIARALAVKPEVLLMDEPTSALDPISTLKVEELMAELKKNYTVAIVTHNMQQATRISDNTAFFLLGEVIEYDNTEKLFSMPKNKKTEEYITGRFG